MSFSFFQPKANLGANTNDPNLKMFVLDDLYKKPIARHPRYRNLIAALRKQFYWPNLKTKDAKCIYKCLQCQ